MFQKFQQLKQLKQLRDQAMAMQKALSQQFVTVEKGNVKVVLSCDQKVHKVEIDGENQEDVVNALNDAIKDSQKEAAKKLQEMGGLGGLGSMLGGQ
jgi:DNA-binding protein YbaB